MPEPVTSVNVNWASVLALWAAAVAGQLGFDRDEALTPGRVATGLNVHTEGAVLGIFTPAPKGMRRLWRTWQADCRQASSCRAFESVW